MKSWAFKMKKSWDMVVGASDARRTTDIGRERRTSFPEPFGLESPRLEKVNVRFRQRFLCRKSLGPPRAL
jgi:hypothetical protein